jgi:hypothetical protein
MKAIQALGHDVHTTCRLAKPIESASYRGEKNVGYYPIVFRPLAIIALLAIFVPATARACACSQDSPGKCPGLQKDDVVFLGTVLAVEDVENGAPAPSDAPSPPVDIVASRLTRYHFRINERFALGGMPDDTTEIDIFSGGDDGDCAYRFKPNEQYVVYTHQGTEGRLFSTICDGTRPAAEARALIPQLRAMRNGKQVASVFGILRRSDPPFLAPPDDPDDPVPNVSLKLRSKDDRFETSTDAAGIYSFYDVHAGEYHYTANLPPRTELTQKKLTGGLPPFKIPDGACFEYNVVALPIGHIRGSVIGPGGKPLSLASLELYRAGSYDDARPGLWAFQGTTGVFDFDHIGPGEYILVYNRANRVDPNSPFQRSFYPGVADISEAKPIKVKDGQQLLKVNLQVKDPYPSRQVGVHLKWAGGRPAGSVTVMAKADQGENPAAQQIGDDLYQFTVLQSANYSISAWDDLTPRRGAPASGKLDCALPDRIDAAPVTISGGDQDAKEVTLIFAAPGCVNQQP